MIEQEELSDSDEEIEEHVEFECEEMTDSEGDEGSGYEQIPEMQDKVALIFFYILILLLLSYKKCAFFVLRLTYFHFICHGFISVPTYTFCREGCLFGEMLGLFRCFKPDFWMNLSALFCNSLMLEFLVLLHTKSARERSLIFM